MYKFVNTNIRPARKEIVKILLHLQINESITGINYNLMLKKTLIMNS